MEPWLLPVSMKRPSVKGALASGIFMHMSPTTTQASRSSVYVWRPAKGCGWLKITSMCLTWTCGMLGTTTLVWEYTPSGELDGSASVRVPLQAGVPCAGGSGCKSQSPSQRSTRITILYSGAIG